MESKDHGSSPVSESDLTKCSKSLKATKGREHSDSLEYDPRIANKLGAFVTSVFFPLFPDVSCALLSASLHEKFDGDLHEIFKVVGVSILLLVMVSCTDAWVCRNWTRTLARLSSTLRPRLRSLGRSTRRASTPMQKPNEQLLIIN